MFARKRKPGPTVVVELRRNPAHTAVAVSASRGFVGLGELPQVKLLVTSLALAGGGMEIHLLQRNVWPRRLVTLDARRGAVRPEQRKAFHVVREVHVFPGFQRVADLAANGTSIAAILHA